MRQATKISAGRYEYMGYLIQATHTQWTVENRSGHIVGIERSLQAAMDTVERIAR